MYVHGIDIIEISRVSEAIQSWGSRFLNRVYTRREIEYCQGHSAELAARFAGKEAVMKALGTGFRGISWRDIEILPDNRGAPLVNLNGKALVRARDMGISDLHISLTHSREYAVASVVGGKDEDRHS